MKNYAICLHFTLERIFVPQIKMLLLFIVIYHIVNHFESKCRCVLLAD